MTDINKYYGNNKPQWTPDLDWYFNQLYLLGDRPEVNKIITGQYDYPIYIIDNAIYSDICKDLVKQIDKQKLYPVGVDGYCDPSNNIGSYRTMGWCEDLAWLISATLRESLDLQSHRIRSTRFAFPFKDVKDSYWLEGSTPYMRFMKYKNGGMHVPHHDAPYHNEEENYITLFSWVLYLNTPEGKGGEFQFVKDKRNAFKHPVQWDTSDWKNMSDDITISIQPKQARLLVFPHWLCHQVNQYIGDDARYIVRGDVAYGY